ncbi:universal stress protein [Rhodosalinus sediminis]|jgi:nucleotide-binding universal stress UspA family protein|uniref:Universal stress protein n=1 Tax=Rhodosalinus sediminis TaxID=1940533 RepID=A0A3D9BPC7_9RHOB|nr:universal stress protein [Rhodosalinus sediminis]REC55379.1 universal stress protein [Rhodosalinus sediminis]
MYDHILVPVSFEEGRDSAGAVEVAATLADEGARITLLHVIEKLPSYAAAYVPTDYVENARAAIEAELARMAEELPGAEVRVVEGHAGRTILDWAAEHAPDCIVIASHRPGMQDLLLGSTATQVVRHAPCAVHVIR